MFFVVLSIRVSASETWYLTRQYSSHFRHLHRWRELWRRVLIITPPPRRYCDLSRKRCIRSTSCLVLVQGFRGRRIEWRYFQFDKIQDGGWRPSWIYKNGHNFGTGLPIDVMFGSRVGCWGFRLNLDFYHRDLQTLTAVARNPCVS